MTARTAPTADARDVADVMVIFGATGDLARKKLHPALYRPSARGRLAVPVVGVARSAWTDEKLRAYARESVGTRYGAVPGPELDAFASWLTYVSGDYGDPATYERLIGATRVAQTYATPYSYTDGQPPGGRRP